MGKKSRGTKKPAPSPPLPPVPVSQPSQPSFLSALTPKFTPHGVTDFNMTELTRTLALVNADKQPSVNDPYGLTCLRSKYLIAGNASFWWVYDDVLTYIARVLAEKSYVVIDGFFNGDNSDPKTHKFREEVKAAYVQGKLPEVGGLVDGRDGKNTSYSTTEVRGDYIGWFDGKESEGWNPALFPDYVLKVSTLVNELKDHLSPSLAKARKGLEKVTSRSRCMVTCYPPGGKYTKHVDNGGAHSNGRRLTCLFYLNEDWKEGDGGELVVYEKGGKIVKDKIQPVADRLVLFWSDDRVPHEVLKASKDRFTVTIWFFDTEEWEEAKRLGIIPKPTVVVGEGETSGESSNPPSSSPSPPSPPSPPRLDFVDSENDAAREPEGQGVSPMVCTNEPFIPEDQEPTLTSVQLKKHQLAKMSGEKTEGGDGEVVFVVSIEDAALAVLVSTTVDVAETEIIVCNDACEPNEIRCDVGAPIEAESVKAKFSKKKGQLKVTVKTLER